MANLVLTVSLTEDGVSLPNFPIIRRLNPAQATPLDGVPVAANSNTSTFNPIPGTSTLASDLQCIVLTADQLVNLQFNADTFLPLSAGAVLVIFGTDITGVVATLATVNNPANSIASNLYGVVAGT